MSQPKLIRSKYKVEAGHRNGTHLVTQVYVFRAQQLYLLPQRQDGCVLGVHLQRPRLFPSLKRRFVQLIAQASNHIFPANS